MKGVVLWYNTFFVLQILCLYLVLISNLMSSIKPVLFCFLLLQCLTAFSQQEKPVFMKWKLKPGEVITYKTVMQEIDVENHKDFSFGNTGKMLGDSVNTTQIQKMLKQVNKELEGDSLITSLTERKKNVIDIEMRLKAKKTPPGNDTSKSNSDFSKFQSLMKQMSGIAMLRGAIHEDGTIESFYIKGPQKNLIATFFELSGKMVSIGDSWSLDINFISMDQSFICDSSYKKNTVTVTGIDHKNGENIVMLKYDIDEYVIGNFDSPFYNDKKIKTSMKMTYQAVAGFSLEKGRWVSYDGIMFLSSTGAISSESTKKFSLIEQ
jgi:hypothetical protein